MNLEQMAEASIYHYPGGKIDKFDPDFQLGERNPDGITRMPQTEEEAIRNRAHTQMTSNNIKKSLQEMRDKLTKMKHNKEVVSAGLAKLDAEYLNRA